MQQILLKCLVSNSKLDKKETVGEPRARNVKREEQKDNRKGKQKCKTEPFNQHKLLEYQRKIYFFFSPLACLARWVMNFNKRP